MILEIFLAIRICLYVYLSLSAIGEIQLRRQINDNRGVNTFIKNL